MLTAGVVRVQGDPPNGIGQPVNPTLCVVVDLDLAPVGMSQRSEQPSSVARGDAVAVQVLLVIEAAVWAENGKSPIGLAHFVVAADLRQYAIITRVASKRPIALPGKEANA